MPETAAADPGNTNPDFWSEPFTDADLAMLLGLVDNPDNLVTASLAGTLYDPEHGSDEGAF